MANKMIQQPLYSIVIPHYGMPDLLERCLQSIPQDNNYQVIVVDNKSNVSDDLLRLVPSLLHNNVTLVNLNDNLWAGHARNVGIEKAIGKWLLFADSDDFFSDNLDSCLSQFSNSDADVIYFNVNGCLSDNIKVTTNRNKKFAFDEFRLSGDERIFRFWYTEPWGKMIRKSLVDEYNIRFDETPVANDYLFSVKIGYYARNIEMDNTIIYWYCSRNNSITTSKKDIKKELQRVFAYARVQEFMQSVGYYTEPGLTSHILNGLFKHHICTYIKTVFRLRTDFNISIFQSFKDLILHYKMKLKGTPLVYGDVYHMDFIKKK